MPARERLAVEMLVDPRAEKPHQRARLGRGDVTERTPAGEHPAGGRMAQIDQIRQMRPLVQLHGRRDLDHLQERDGALLHAGAARARRRQQRQALARGPLDGGGDPLRGGDPDRAGQEVELAGHQRHGAAEHGAHAGQHGFVQTGLGGRGIQFAPVLVGAADCQRRGVPADERPLVKHGVAKRKGADPAHRKTLYRVAP